ncbi:sensor histidine kinase [Hamadaea tsunoensis]|uniref:sensor histidine kinase n=1 Tax=Hamadaea tsunoensis TaxID=53368 RepID=UPI00042848E1|nr:HAMP domain-containing sensor histidine kinase [Hamadaea tsunoensis]
MRVRLTARARLTILYTALVLATGIVLAGLTYVLMLRRPVHAIQLTWTSGTNPMPPAPSIVDGVRAATLSDLLTQAAVALAVVTLLGAALGWWLAGRVLRPIRGITETARRLSAENLSERVPVGPAADELTTLAATVNGMLDRVQAGLADRDRILDSQRMFTANAAHELRTPLTTMRTALDVTLDGEPGRDELLAMAADIRIAIDRSRDTLDGLLTLAHSQAGPVQRTPVDLATIAADQVNGETVTDLLPAPVHGDPVLLDRMVGNLLDNAVRYGSNITVHTGVSEGRAHVRIGNDGRAISPDEQVRLLEPFFRGRAARTRHDGVGLGLSIVRAIVTAHEGSITLHPRATGGLDAHITFPLP